MTRTRIAEILIVLFALIVAGKFYTWAPQHSYQVLVHSPDFVRAATNVSRSNLDAVRSKYKIDYQEFDNAKLSYSTNPSLPTPSLIEGLSVGGGVIRPTTAEYLADTAPYQVISHWRRYFYFPVVKDPHQVFVVYRRVL